ncbi:hypothetical protein DV735_g5799, partial [Chaetothyriales sp. CBS 134920]
MCKRHCPPHPKGFSVQSNSLQNFFFVRSWDITTTTDNRLSQRPDHHAHKHTHCHSFPRQHLILRIHHSLPRRSRLLLSPPTSPPPSTPLPLLCVRVGAHLRATDTCLHLSPLRSPAIAPIDMQDESLNSAVGDDDFSKFLDLDTDFSFGGIDHAPSGLDTPMGRLAFGPPQPQQTTMHSLGFNTSQTLNLDVPQHQHQHQHQPRSAPYPSHIPTSQSFESFQQQQYAHMQIGRSYHVPPTPVSSEMHASKFGPGMENAQVMFDCHPVSFTPLVSPAQTPLHGGFNLGDYTSADDFFSPLTSPALEAQAQYGTGATASPVDLNADPIAKPAPPSRGVRRKGSMSARPGASRSVRQSPVTRAQRARRPASSTNLALEKLDEGRVQQTLQPHLPNPQARASDDSVSPEPLSEGLMMRPPPVPQLDHSPQPADSSDPVTPATLMRIPSNQKMPPDAGDGVPRPIDEVMEDIMLPAAAAHTPSHSPLNDLDSAAAPADHDSTPVLLAKSAKVSANSTPRSGLPKTSSQDSFTKPSRADGRAGRASKKRQSTSSAAISPALRPKISPGISPLVPASGALPTLHRHVCPAGDDAVDHSYQALSKIHVLTPISGPGMSHLSAETSALYLASKSNYQNIIDGTHLPGVSYPEALAENLSSKRTSHKLAEQGRRNRINLALKEIESLLPASITAAVNKREKHSATSETDNADKAAPSIQGASKASTVEMAIVYIKSLQAELKMTQDKLETAEKKLADGGSSAGSQTSD